MSRFQEKGAGPTARQSASARLAGCALVTVVAAAGWAGTAAAEAIPLGVHLSLRGEYVDNLSGRSNGALRPGLQRKDDYIYSPSLALNTGTSIGRQRITVVGTVGYKFHQYNTALDAVNIGLQTGMSTSVGRCVLAPTADYARRQQNLEDVPLGPPKGIKTETGLGLSASCPVGRIVPSVTVAKHWSRSNSEFGVDSSSTQANASVGYRGAGLGVISLVASYSKTAYDRPTNLSFPILNSGYESYSAGFNYSRPIGARLSGTGGLQYYRSKSQFSSDAHGISGNAGLSYRATPRLNLDLTAQRSIRPATQAFASRSLDTEIELQASYRMSSRLGFTGSVRQLRKSYDTVFVPTSLAPSRERRFTVRTGASYRLGDKTSLALEYSRETRDSDTPGLNYSSNRVAVTAARSF
jgi:hypothetical protein